MNEKIDKYSSKEEEALLSKTDCHDFIGKHSGNCNVINEQVSRLNKNSVNIINKSPIYLTIKINKKNIVQIPAGKNMFIYKKDKSVYIEEGDVIEAWHKNFKVFSKEYSHTVPEITMGLAEFIDVKENKGTGMYVNNNFPIPFEFWYGKNYIGNISPRSRTYIDVFRQGFKENTEIFFKSIETKGAFRMTIPSAEYGKHQEVVLGLVY